MCDLGKVTELLSGSVFSSVRYRCVSQIYISTFCGLGMVPGGGGTEGHKAVGSLAHRAPFLRNTHCNKYYLSLFYHHRTVLGSVGDSGHQR